MPTIFEIKKSYGAEQAKLLTYSFDIKVAAGAIRAELDESVRENLDQRSLSNADAAQGELWGQAELQMTKDKYVELDLEIRAAVEARLEEIEEELRPKNASFADYAAAAALPEEALITALDMSLASGDDDSALVALSAARNRNLEQAVAHATTINERWADLFAELAEAEAELDLEPEKKFSLFAQPAPTAADIRNGTLSAPQSNANVLGRIS